MMYSYGCVRNKTLSYMPLFKFFADTVNQDL